MDDAYLTPREARLVTADLDFARRCELRMLFGEELVGENFEGRTRPFRNVVYYQYERPNVTAGDVFEDGRDWIVVDTAFGRRYLALADYKGGFLLLSLLNDGGSDVYVRFDRPVPMDHPNRHDDDYTRDPRPVRNRRQYAQFIVKATELLEGDSA
jgi:hypothetical protein